MSTKEVVKALIGAGHKDLAKQVVEALKSNDFKPVQEAIEEMNLLFDALKKASPEKHKKFTPKYKSALATFRHLKDLFIKGKTPSFEDVDRFKAAIKDFDHVCAVAAGHVPGGKDSLHPKLKKAMEKLLASMTKEVR